MRRGVAVSRKVVCCLGASEESRRCALLLAIRRRENTLADGRIPVEENVAVSLLECAGHEKNAVIEGWSACERGRLTKRWFASGRWSGRVPVDLSDWKGLGATPQWLGCTDGGRGKFGRGPHPGSAVGVQGSCILRRYTISIVECLIRQGTVLVCDLQAAKEASECTKGSTPGRHQPTFLLTNNKIH
jgi:hypothetical protein